MREPVVERLLNARRQCVLRVPQPPGRRRVGREAACEEKTLAFALRRLVSTEQFERLVGTERILEIAKIDARDELIGRHVGQQLPKWLALDARMEVPDRIDERRRR